MTDRHDYVALEWVKGEIAETLKQARQALEAYVDNPQDPTRMRFCLTYVHQVQGTLQMVEFYGAALLAEEMEQLAQALIDGRASNQREALEVLMQAILQLPLYLDRIQSARRDLPMALLPLLNDLRAARGEKLLSETSLFAPDLSSQRPALPVETLARLRTAELPVLLRKMRQMLQAALVGIIRGQDLATNLGYMARVFARLESLCQDAPLEPLWKIASALVEGLANGSVANGSSVRNLLREVDKELKRLLDQGADGFNQPAPEDLVKNLLFYIAKAPAQSPRIRAIKEQYRLDEALPDSELVDEERARLAGPDRGAMRSVVTALCEELVRVKDSLDLFVRSDRHGVTELDGLLAPLKQIADTLAVLGFGQPRKVILDQIDVIHSLSLGQREPSDAVLMDVAGALLYVEATLAGMVGPTEDAATEASHLPTTDVAQIHQLVIKEARNGLEQAKDAIIEFIASQWNHEHLTRVPELLTQARGGLAMIPLPRAAALLAACNRYIQEQLLARKAVPNWQSLDTLADAITSVEYYLERLSEDHATQGDLILDVAEESLENLGYPIQEKPSILDHETEEEAEPLAPLADPLQDIEVLAAEEAELEQHLDPEDDIELDLTDLHGQPEAIVAPAPAPLSGSSELLVSDDNWSLGEAALDATEQSIDLSLDAPLQWEDTPALSTALPGTAQELPGLEVDELDSLSAAGDILTPDEGERPELNLDNPLEFDHETLPSFDLADLEELPPALPADAEATRLLLPPADDETLPRLDLDELESLPAAGDLLTPSEGEWLDLSQAPAMEFDREALPSFDLADLEELPPALPADGEVLDLPLPPASGEVLPSLDFDEQEELSATEPPVDLDGPSLDELSTPLEWDEAALAELGLPEVELPTAPLEAEPSAPAEERPLSLAEVMATPVPAFNPPAQEVPPSLLPPPADEEPVDDELQEVFIEEAGEVLETLGEYLPRWRADINDRDSLGEVRRAFHTLKGSGRMVRALVIGELSWSIENLLNRVLDRSIQADEPVLQVIDDVVTLLPALVEEYAAKAQRQRNDVDRLAAIAHALAKGQSLPKPDAPGSEPAVEPAGTLQTLANSPAEETLDPQLLEIFRNEAENHLDTLAAFLANCDQWLPRTINDDLQRALHTLKGSAHMAGILPIAEIATPLEKLAKEYKANLLAIDLSEAELLHEALHLLRQGVAQLDSTPLAPIPGTQALLERIAQLHQERLGAVVSARRDDKGESRDPQMISLFLAEGMDILLDAEDLLRRWREHPGERQELGALLDELSTLGRGAEMAELPQIEELCEALLDCYGAVDEGSLPVNERFFREAESAHEALISMMDQVAAALEVSAQPERVQALHALLQDTIDPHALAQLGPDLPDNLDVEGATPEPTEPEPTQAAFAEMPSTLDEEMVSIFLEEAVDILDSAGKALGRWLDNPENPTALLALQRDLHTLKGGARMAEIGPIGDLAHELESLYEGLQDRRYAYSPRLAGLLQSSHDCLATQLQQLQAHQPLTNPAPLIQDIRSFRQGSAQSLSAAVVQSFPDFEDSFADADETPGETRLDDDEPVVDEAPEQAIDREPLAEQPAPPSAPEPDDAPPAHTALEPNPDPELVEIFLEEGFDILDNAGAALQRWMEAPDNTLEVEALQRDLHTLKGGARMAEIGPIGDLAHELEFLYERLCDGRLRASPALFDLLQSCHDRLAEMLEAVRARRPQPDGTPLIQAIQAWRVNPDEQLSVPSTVHLQPLAAEPPETVAEADILDIFLEEADDLLEAMETSIGRWEEAREDANHIDDVLRVLHTLKGGARLAGQKRLGDLAHDLEQHLVEAQQQGAPWPDSLFLDVQSGYEGLQAELDQLRQQLDYTLAADVTLAISFQPETRPQNGLIVAASVQPTEAVAERVLPFVRRAEEAAQDAAARRAPQELVKVPAELLEGLVNLAGETSIFRGRVEQQVSDFSFTLAEMEATIERVRDQLRRLDTETQAQILSRYQAEAERAGYEEFDPLEMDRHSQLQQLSRALFESASDLLDLKETLAARNRDAETLLLQQARVNTELQEGLMRTRMVPFDRLVPRLRRIVRQVASELGKQVEFIVGNAEGEMDRTVLERMVAPLEHMLRNAVDHGIESAEQRQASGKSQPGNIRLNLSREGGDIVLTLADDGAGIRLEAVRRKAIERGMMDPNADLSDHEVLQFILEPGFSTADKVTQISGRGVGMDVVHSEVKQLGGSMSIDSTLGEGTRFLIRLPFTVSVNRALMVLSGEDLYAIPLNTIEGIVRVSPYELETYYQPNAPRFEYAGQDYELRYLGDLLNNGQHPKLVGHSLPLPVILVRSSEHAVAVQVDALVGSREIVVKSLGPQFAGVHGISGATILGDGRVVVILDLLATIRVRHAHLTQPQLRLASANPAVVETEQERPPLVMVVDDSVTVRKVTSRLLERNGMNVVTAKDGVDAITLLQEHHPDIMLLDIEMPRMDGFEVATLVRHDSRLKDLPIIMITSRTGEKHRERAIAIGVNEYLGKPYQESLLLETIQQLVKRT
ncbi:Hpt domain-containing protein [Metapseudomonas boanensis]|uniref:histidine kinase n=1 Tax=Metapseudomonas boanensis TaxID=2822138 RepID=A0ABS5XJ64_9GAMM|nr:Hpt domain-containing protein [Pseudomonas boanensis]MBT8767733.1 Hpt domain-containing protein [Pseudomonas boanensis]